MRTVRRTISAVTATTTVAGVVVPHYAPTNHLPRIFVGSKCNRYSQSERIDNVSSDHNGSIRGPQCPVIVHAAITAAISTAVVASRFVQRYPLYFIPVAPFPIPPQHIVCHGLNVLVQPKLTRTGRYLDPLERRSDGIEAVQAGEGCRARLSRRCRRCTATAADAAVQRRAKGRVGRRRGIVRIGRIGIDRRGRFGPVVHVSPALPTSLLSLLWCLLLLLLHIMHGTTGRDEGPARTPLLSQPLQLLLEQLLLLIGRQQSRRYLLGRQSSLHRPLGRSLRPKTRRKRSNCSTTLFFCLCFV